MNKKRINKKIIIYFLCVILVMTSVIATILYEDSLHTLNCCDDDCIECIFVHFSTNFIKNISIINRDLLIFIIFLSIIQFIKINMKKVKKLSQIDLKVIKQE